MSPEVTSFSLVRFRFTWAQEMYLLANDGENHTNNVKQLENMKKALEDLSAVIARGMKI